MHRYAMDLSCETNIHIMSSFVDYFCCLCLMFVFVVLFCLFLVAWEKADLMAFLCVVFSCVCVTFPYVY